MIGKAMATFAVRKRYTHRDTDRHGNVRIYFCRGKGHPKIRLHQEPGTKAFDLEYEAAFNGTVATKESDRRIIEPIIPGSFRAWTKTYFGSCSEFLALDPETQRVRRRIFEAMWREPTKPGSKLTFGNCPIGTMTPRHIGVLRDRKAKAPHAGNSRLKALSKLFQYLSSEEVKAVDVNPVKGVARLRSKKKGGHHTWTQDEIDRYEGRHPIGTKPRLALALFLYTGLRISDVSRLGRQHARQGRVKLVLFKNRNSNPVEVDAPILPELAAVIAASKTGDLHFLVTEYGKPFSTKGLGQKMRVWCDQAGVPGAAHGLRKAGATRAAENGATEHQLMAIYGWLDNKQAATYTKTANRKRLADSGMHLLSKQTEDKKLPLSGEDEELVGKPERKTQ